MEKNIYEENIGRDCKGEVEKVSSVSRYQRFKKAMNDLRKEESLIYCNTLINSAVFYTAMKEIEEFYRKNKNMIKEKNKEFLDEKESAKGSGWTITNRFVMYLYYEQKARNYNDDADDKKYKFVDFLNGVFSSKKMLEADLECEYYNLDIDKNAGIEDVMDEEQKMIVRKVQMIREAFEAWQEYNNIHKEKNYKKDHLLNYDGFEKMLISYIKLHGLKAGQIDDYSIESCFDKTFSENDVENLIYIMETKEVLLPMYIIPINSKLRGNGELSEKRTKWITLENEKNFHTMFEYVEKCNDEIKKYKPMLYTFADIYMMFDL